MIVTVHVNTQKQMISVCKERIFSYNFYLKWNGGETSNMDLINTVTVVELVVLSEGT